MSAISSPLVTSATPCGVVMPSVGVLASQSVVSASRSRCSLYASVRPSRVPHTARQIRRSCTLLNTSYRSVQSAPRHCISCTAQRGNQQQPVDVVTPEIVPEDEQCDLPAVSQSAPVQSRTTGPASWLLAGYQKKVTTLLGFAGLSAASLIGT